MRPERDWLPIERAARGSWRVLRLQDLEALGLGRRQIRSLITRGQLHPMHRGIYLYGHPEPEWQGSLLAGQYAAGPGAYLTHGSGLAVMRLWRPYTRRIHLTSTVNRRDRDGLVIHRRSRPCPADEVRHEGPLRYAALPRLLLELAPTSNDRQLGGLITKAVRQDKLDHALMRTVLSRYPTHPGAGPLARAYAGYLPEPGARSELERRFDRERLHRPWIPEPVTNVLIEAGGIRWEVDRYWPEHRVGVEVDSRTYHQALADRAKDELKRAKLLTIGIEILSISDWRMEYSVADALDDLELILARRRTGLA